MKYEVVTKDNLELVVKIQNEIFPTENGKQNYIEAINKTSGKKEMIYWIVYAQDIPIGILGLYSYNEYPNDAWLGWYGVLPNHQNKGYGSKMFDYFEKIAKEKHYQNIRLYTDKVMNVEAQKLYLKKGMVCEEYKNSLEDKLITDTTLIFSKSLTNGRIELWNNKFLELTEQLKKQDM